MVQNASWEWLLQGFKIDLETQLKPKTVKDYCDYVYYFARWVQGNNKSDACSITKRDIQEFLHFVAFTPAIFVTSNGAKRRIQKTKLSTVNLIEVYPGAAWPVLAGYRLKKKRLLEGRRARYDLMVRLGITFAQRYSIELPPTHDQLDAAVAAYIAYLFKSGKTCNYGEKPFEDTSLGILREGLIIQPFKSA